MKLETFKTIFKLNSQVDLYLEETRDIAGIDFYGSILTESFWSMMYLMWNNEYTEEGVDLISWYLYEMEDEPEDEAEEYPRINSIEELWERVEVNHKVNKGL